MYSQGYSHAPTGPDQPITTGSITPMTTSILADQQTQATNTDITTTVASFLAEEKEKDRRRLNLIVHQLIEPIKIDTQK